MRSTRHRCFTLIAALFAFSLATVAPLRAATTRTWVGGSGEWFTEANWTNAAGAIGIPEADDTVFVSSGSILLTNATAALAAFEIENATLTFSNWNAALTAVDVTIKSGGILTHVANSATDTNAFGEWVPDARVWINCTDFDLQDGGKIEVDGKGYGSDGVAGVGFGPGRGIRQSTSATLGATGAGHGGIGGRAAANQPPGKTYGSLSEPIDPGSGGIGRVNNNTPGTRGGGAVRIDASGKVTINGTISANGIDTTAYSVGCGSGGSIYIECNEFGGDSGILSTKGGTGTRYSVGGGGGRIAVHYSQTARLVNVAFYATGGGNGSSLNHGDLQRSMPSHPNLAEIGSILFTNSDLADAIIDTNGGADNATLNGFIHFAATNIWRASGLKTISGVLGISSNNVWELQENLTISNGKLLLDNHATLSCAGDLTLTNEAVIVIYSGETNALDITHGALVEVAGTLNIVSNGNWIYPYSHSTNGGSALFRLGNLKVGTGSGIDADGRGFYQRLGPGRGTRITSNSGGGGGYGGHGGRHSHASGAIYGNTNAPIDPGSGGIGRSHSDTDGQDGGGLIRIEAAGLVLIDGMLFANGISCGNYRSAGSGGAIFIICRHFRGQGILRADGGNGGTITSAGGGGGRIAVWQNVPENVRLSYLAGHPTSVTRFTEGNFPTFSGAVTTDGGTADAPAEDGESYFFLLKGSMFMFR